MFNVIEIDKLNHENVNIKKPYTFKKNFNHEEIKTFDVYNENKYLLLLTKTLQIYSKNNYCLDFVQNKKKGCLHFLDKLLKSIIKRIKAIDEYKPMFDNKNILSNFKYQENCRILTIKDICYKDTCVFDTNNEVIQMENIKVQDNVRLILYIKNIWIKSDSIGINIKVSQIQRLEPLLLCKSLFKNIQNTNVKNLNPPPIPPPVPPPLINKNRIFQLKEKKDKNIMLLNQKNENSKQICPLRAIHTRPSLSDIIASKNKLRKTNILC